MSDFESEAELSVSLDQGSLRDVRGEIESALSDIPVGVEAGDLGGGGGGSTQQPRDPNSGEFMSIEGVEQRLVDQTAILTEVKDLADQRNAILGSSGGDTDSRERRRRRREFRWARQRTDFAEQQVALLEEIKDKTGEGGGGGIFDILSGAVGKTTGGAVGSGVGTSALGVGAGVGAAGLGIGGGVGLAAAGAGIGRGAAEEGFATESFQVEVGSISLEDFNPTLKPQFDPTFNPKFAPKFAPKFTPTFNTNIDVTTDISPELSADINFSPTVNISPKIKTDVDISAFEQDLRGDLQDYADEQVNDTRTSLQDEIDNLVGRVERALNI